jgi:aryl-alcohol dehydrogenase-like predicted oxidoreductase
MQYRTLGRTGIKVCPYALGAMMFGAPSALAWRAHPQRPPCS